EKIYLFGGGYYAETLARQLQQDTDVPTTAVTLSYPQTKNSVTNFVPSLMGTSLGLGLRELQRNWSEVNILPPTLRSKKSKFNIKTTIALSLTVILLLMGLFTGKIIHNNLTLASLDEQLQAVKSQAGDLEKIDIQYEALKQFTEIFADIDKQFPLKLPVIAELSRKSPQDTWLSDISFSKNKMEIKGLSASASRLVPILENSSYFKDTSFNGSIVTQGNGEKFTIRSTTGAPQ
ncbi:MAG: PilN domain-containing protein, partial [Nitrospinota bacterium]|nr:PilN domain-containing protein [Nitrospinota bacterium]